MNAELYRELADIMFNVLGDEAESERIGDLINVLIAFIENDRLQLSRREPS